MKHFIFTITIIVFYTHSSWSQHSTYVDEGKISGNIYRSVLIGWSIQIPDDWELSPKPQQEKIADRGITAIEEANNEELEYDGLLYLISFYKSKFNVFQSSAEFMKGFTIDDWKNNNKELKGMLYKTYLANGMNRDTSSSTALIDQWEFEVFNIIITDQNGELLGTQVMYNRFVNGYDFGINLSYTNELDKNEMMKALFGSKFE